MKAYEEALILQAHVDLLDCITCPLAVLGHLQLACLWPVTD